MDFSKLSQYVFACYDYKEDEIRHCEKGSWAWWHERGHQEQYKKSGLARALIDNTALFLFLTVMALVFESMVLKWVFFSIFFISWQYPEFDAWWYAIKNHGKMVD